MELQERKDAFSSLHEIVVKGLASFEEVGIALMRIRDEELYKTAGYKSFKDYFEARHGMHRSRAYQLIAAAKVARKHDVTNEHVAKKLSQVPEEDQAEVLEIATSRMGDDLTGSMIEDVAEEVKQTRDISDNIRPSDSKFREILLALRHVSKSIDELHQGHGKFIDLNITSGALKTLEQAIKHAVLTHECPACHGRRSECHVCKGLGWLPQVIWDTRSEAFRS